MEQGAEETVRGLGVVQGAVRLLQLDSQQVGQHPQAVSLGVGQKDAGKLERVEGFVFEQLGVAAQKAQVELYAVADDGPLAGEAGQAGEHVVQAGCASHVVVADAGQLGDLAWDGAARVDKGSKDVQRLVVAESDRADLDDGVAVGV